MSALEQTSKRHPALLGHILLASALLKAIYVFGFTDYSAYVVSDPAHYFYRAMALHRGEGLGPADWTVFPMGSTVLLAGYWHVLALLGIDHHHLESALTLNIVTSTVCVALLWRTAYLVTASRALSLAIAAAYSVFYPLIYLNAFTLSEAPAQLLFMLSVLCLLESQHSARWRRFGWLALAGLSWALAVHCRPSLMLCVLATAIWLLLQRRGWVQTIKELTSFGFPAMLVFAIGQAAVWQASAGQWRTATGSNGGMNLFMQQCHLHGAETFYKGERWRFVPPLASDQPELGVYQGSVPFYEQGFYYRAGLDCLFNDPGSVKRLLAYAPTMLYGNFMPSWYSAWGFKNLLLASQHMSLVLILCCPAGYLALRRRDHRPADLLVLNALLLIATFVLFNADHRHVYSLSFIYFLLGAFGIVSLAGPKRSQLPRYAAIAGAVALIGSHLFAGEGALSVKNTGPLSTKLARVQRVVAEGAPWNSLATLRFASSVWIRLGNTQHTQSISLSLDNNDQYLLEFYKGRERLAGQSIPAVRSSGMRLRQVAVPVEAAAVGYDRLKLTAIDGDGRYSIAGLTLRP